MSHFFTFDHNNLPTVRLPCPFPSMNGSHLSTRMYANIATNQHFPVLHHHQPSLIHGINVPARGELLPDIYSEPNQFRHEYIEAEPEQSRRKNSRKRNTSEIDRVQIKTAADCGLSTIEIIQKFGFTRNQIYYALRNSSKPKTCGNGRKPAISEEKAKQLGSWICKEPHNRQVPYQSIPDIAPELGLQGYGEKAIRTAVESQGFGRRVSKINGFSNQEVNEIKKRRERKKKRRIGQGDIFIIQQGEELCQRGQIGVERVVEEGQPETLITKHPCCRICGITGHNARTCQRQ